MSGNIAAVVREGEGTLLTGVARRVFTSSALVAEAQAIREGLLLALDLQAEMSIIESDYGVKRGKKLMRNFSNCQRCEIFFGAKSSDPVRVDAQRS